jgi:hypothetical protein
MMMIRPVLSIEKRTVVCIFRMMKNGTSSTPSRPVISVQHEPSDSCDDMMKSPSCHVSMEMSNIATPQPLQKERRSTKWCIDDFHVGRRLGEGSYSTVILVEEKKTGFLCALKVIKVRAFRPLSLALTLDVLNFRNLSFVSIIRNTS